MKTPLWTILVFPLIGLPGYFAAAAENSTNGAATPGKIRVALYCDQGSLTSAPQVEKCLKVEPNRFQWKRVTAEEIRQGILANYDVVVQGGGSGSKQAKTLEPAGCEEERKFVKGGGGYLGICAGAYLASANYDWSLKILNAKVIDREHWARGKGDVKLLLSAAGTDLLGIHEPSVQCRYCQGPLLSPSHADGLPDYTALTTFGTEIALKGAPHGVMIGTTAMASGKYGKGRVFVSSPHPEATAGLDHIIRTAVCWLAKQEQAGQK